METINVKDLKIGNYYLLTTLRSTYIFKLLKITNNISECIYISYYTKDYGSTPNLFGGIKSENIQTGYTFRQATVAEICHLDLCIANDTYVDPKKCINQFENYEIY